MDLVSEIQAIMYCPVNASPKEREKAVRQIIESYRRAGSEYYDPDNSNSVLERVCKGKTTFEQEVKKLNPNRRLPLEFRAIFSSDFSIGYKSRMLDQTIRRLYWN
jgi:hypothetical protein